MNAVALHRSPWGRARDLLACALIVVGITIPMAAFAQALSIINGDVTQKVALSDLRAMSDETFTLYDPYQGRDVEMQGLAFRTFLIEQFGEVPPALHFTAWDDYEVTLEGWDDPSWYLITAEDGDPLTIRSRGPARLVERDYGDRDVENLREFNDWIWMIRSIEAKW
ncbi:MULTISPECIES: hypothetical protein [unclassified Halomonas]|uniref:hypothetical protein n=1 Tax=unclassified Halomonas TaxID=2609666 RepID=UPI0007D9F807|nr:MULTISPECIES: hypothetical protein [unclassified Halomonas]OAL61232.1 hypothetical protein A6R74_16745 [Halomonas sp. ALS9]